MLPWIMLAIFAWYYYWTVRPRPPVEFGAYTALADAFHHGRLSTALEPSPELLALPDPYDPVQNARVSHEHDGSLYNGHYYYYFGPTPVLAVYLPYLLWTGKFLPDRMGTWLFATAAYGMGCLLLKLLLNRWWPQSPRWMFYFLLACLGFSNTFPFLLRRPAAYETAIAAGQFFMLLALYAIARSALGVKYSLWMAALGGAALAAAFGSRPQLVLAAGALGWFLILPGEVARRERRRRLAAALVPLTIGVALVLLYNYARFDSPFEFGNHYQLAALPPKTYIHLSGPQYLGIPRLMRNLWFSMLEPPRLRSTFPFIVLAPNPPFRLPRNVLGLELVAGIAWTAPLVLLLAAAPVVWRRLEAARRVEWSVLTGTLVFLGAVWILVDATVGATMRYVADFAAVLFVAAVLVLAGLSGLAQPRAKKWMYRGVVALGLFGVFVNGAIGMTGYYDNFRTQAPAQYEKLADWFSPVAKVLAWCGIPPDRTPAPEVSR